MSKDWDVFGLKLKSYLRRVESVAILFKVLYFRAKRSVAGSISPPDRYSACQGRRVAVNPLHLPRDARERFGFKSGSIGFCRTLRLGNGEQEKAANVFEVLTFPDSLGY